MSVKLFAGGVIVSLLSAMADPPLFQDAILEGDSIRVNGKMHAGKLELVGEGGQSLLVSKDSIETLGREISVQVGSGREVRLAPGLKLERAIGGFRFITYNDKLIQISGEEGKILRRSPCNVKLTQNGWDVGDHVIKGHSIGVALTDGAPASAVPPARAAGPRNPPVVVKVRRVFGENPFLQGGAFESHFIRQLPHVSPAGF